MAFAAANVQARIQRKKLIERAKSLTDQSVNKTKERFLINLLRNDPSTMFLADMITGKSFLVFSQYVFLFHATVSDESRIREGENVKDEVPEDALAELGPLLTRVKEEQTLPSDRPHYISRRHFEFLHAYFNERRKYDPQWLLAYLGDQANVGRKQHDSRDSLISNADSHERVQDSSTYIQRCNECILLCQVFSFANLLCLFCSLFNHLHILRYQQQHFFFLFLCSNAQSKVILFIPTNSIIK